MSLVILCLCVKVVHCLHWQKLMTVLHALLESAGCAGKPVTADTVSYSLAPRLNAAGRMDNAAVAIKLLLCGDEE